MRIFHFVRYAILIAFAPIITAGAPGANQPFLVYHHHNSFSQKDVRITIQTSGTTVVIYEEYQHRPFQYQTTLSPAEMKDINKLLASSKFFDQSNHDTQYATDVGQTEISVHAKGRDKTLNFAYRPELDSLTTYLWRLVGQAKVIRNLESDTDLASVVTAVNPRHVGEKALQPKRLKEPIMTYLRRQHDRDKSCRVLEAFAFVTTPEEFINLINVQLADKSQRENYLLMIASQPFASNIPRTHWLALCPIYLAFVQDNFGRMKEMSDIEREAFIRSTSCIGDLSYRPAVPVLQKWFESSHEPYLTTEIYPLANMGTSSISILTPYLDSSDESYRIKAVKLLGFTAKAGPASGYTVPVSEREFSQMIPVFTKTIIPKIRKMAASDPSEKVRAAAAQSLPEIEISISPPSQ